MGKYKVSIIENTVRTRSETIAADSSDEAEQFVMNKYENGKYEDDGWDIPDDGGVEFEAEEL